MKQQRQTGPVGPQAGAAMSDVVVEFDAFDLHNQHGEIYHTIPAAKCRIGIVSRRVIRAGPDGRDVELEPFTEAAFIRNNGAWLPPLFYRTQTPDERPPLVARKANPEDRA